MKHDNVFYRQCRLRHLNTHQVAWIPEKFAKKGKFIEIKKDDGEWENGWEVMSDGGSTRLSHSTVVHQERAWTKHRKFSDI